jgi:hypothetical protein
MTAHQTATLIIRLLGVVWFLALLNQVGAAALLIGSGSLPQVSTGYYLLLTAVQLFGCSLLWLWPASIAARLLPSALSDRPQAVSSPQQWQTIGVVCVGLWALAGAVPEAIRWLTLWRAAAHTEISGAFGPAQQAGLMETLLRIGIGLWLTLGGKGISAALFRLRMAGIKVEAGGDNTPG